MGFNDRSLAKKARTIGSLTANLETYALPVLIEAGRDGGEGLRQFIDDGRDFQDELIEVIHRDLDAREVDRRAMNDWFRRASALWQDMKRPALEAHRNQEPWYE